MFYTYPTEYDYIFYGKRILHYPLIPFKWLSEKSFSKVVRVYAKLLDIGLLLFKNKDRKEWIKKQFHCNPLTKDRLKDILERAGYEIKLLDVENLYDYHNDIQGKFKKHEYLYRNIYGIASPKV